MLSAEQNDRITRIGPGTPWTRSPDQENGNLAAPLAWPLARPCWAAGCSAASSSAGWMTWPLAVA